LTDGRRDGLSVLEGLSPSETHGARRLKLQRNTKVRELRAPQGMFSDLTAMTWTPRPLATLQQRRERKPYIERWISVYLTVEKVAQIPGADLDHAS
jgi:hypothetical protein